MGQCNYASAKAGIVGLTRSVARDLGRYGVTCNAVCPLAQTRMTMDETVKAGLQKRLTLGLIAKEKYEQFLRMPGPEFIAPTVVWLAAESTGGLNGQVIGAMGGRIYLYSEPVAIKELVKEDQSKPWEVDDLVSLASTSLLQGYVNPAPNAAQ